MLNSKFDQVFEERCIRGLEWLKANPLADAHADRLRLEAMSLLETGCREFVAVRDMTQRENDEHKAAARDLGRADQASERAFETIFFRTQAHSYQLRARSVQDFEEFQAASQDAFGGLTPSEFAPLRIALSLEVLDKATRFAGQHLGANDPDVRAAQDAHADLERCRSVARTEESEYATAMTRLIDARDTARIYYSSARDVISAALRLVGADNLNRVLPSIYNLYGARAKAAASDSADVSAPAADEPSAAVVSDDEMN